MHRFKRTYLTVPWRWQTPGWGCTAPGWQGWLHTAHTTEALCAALWFSSNLMLVTPFFQCNSTLQFDIGKRSWWGFTASWKSMGNDNMCTVHRGNFSFAV